MGTQSASSGTGNHGQIILRHDHLQDASEVPPLFRAQLPQVLFSAADVPAAGHDEVGVTAAGELALAEVVGKEVRDAPGVGGRDKHPGLLGIQLRWVSRSGCPSRRPSGCRPCGGRACWPRSGCSRCRKSRRPYQMTRLLQWSIWCWTMRARKPLKEAVCSWKCSSWYLTTMVS